MPDRSKTLRDYGLEYEKKQNGGSAAEAALRSYGKKFEQEKAQERTPLRSTLPANIAEEEQKASRYAGGGGRHIVGDGTVLGELRAEENRALGALNYLGNSFVSVPFGIYESAKGIAKQAYKDLTNGDRVKLAATRDAMQEAKRAGKDSAEYRQAEERYKAAQKEYEGREQETIDKNSLFMRLQNRADESMRQALEGTKGVDRFLRSTGISILDNVTTQLPAYAVPALAPVTLAAMSAKAGVQRTAELTRQGVPVGDAAVRGALAGGVEAATESVSLGSLLDLIKTGGKGVVVNLLKQAGVEGGEELTSYIADYIADRAAKDPNARFDIWDALEQAAGGAVSGLVLGGGASYLGAKNGIPVQSAQEETAREQTPGAEIARAQEAAAQKETPAAEQQTNVDAEKKEPTAEQQSVIREYQEETDPSGNKQTEKEKSQQLGNAAKATRITSETPSADPSGISIPAPIEKNNTEIVKPEITLPPQNIEAEERAGAEMLERMRQESRRSMEQTEREGPAEPIVRSMEQTQPEGQTEPIVPGREDSEAEVEKLLNEQDAREADAANEAWLRSLEDNRPPEMEEAEKSAGEMADYLADSEEAEAEERRRDAEHDQAREEMREAKLKDTLRKLRGDYAGQDPHTIDEVRSSIDEIGPDTREDKTDYTFAAQMDGSRTGYNQTLAENLDKAAGKDTTLRQILREVFERPLWKAKEQYSANVQTKLGDLYRYTQELGIEKGSPESAAAQRIGEGFWTDEKGDTHEYTLNDLKEQFPQSWEKILDLSKYARQVYDAYIGEMNAMLEQIYPNVEQKAQEQKNNALSREKYFRAQAQVQLRLQQEIEQRIEQKKAALGTKREGTRIRAQIENSIARDERILSGAQAQEEKYISAAELARQRAQAVQKSIDSGEILKNRRLVPRKDYFHHFQETAQGFAALRNIIETPGGIDSALSGASEYTQPKSKWAGFLQHREGGAYQEDAVEGLLKYIPAAEYKLAVDPIIAQGRAQIKGIADATSLTKNANGFLVWYTDYINDLAGKTNPMWDRSLQKIMGRKTIDVLRWINGRVKANAVTGNARSAIAQVFNLQNAALTGLKNPADWKNGSRLFAADLAGDEDARGILGTSGFLTERYLDGAVSQFDSGILKTPKKFANWMMTVGDQQATKLIWCAAYEKGLRAGVDNAVEYADDITRRTVAGRGIGDVPLTQKSQVVQLIAPFQVEVNNTWNLLRTAAGEKDATGLILFALISWLMNEPLRQLFGFDVSFDPINAAVESAKSWDSGKNAMENVNAVAGRAGGELLGAMPMGSQIAQIAVPDETDRQNVFGESDPTRYGTGNIGLNMIASPAIKAKQGKNFAGDLLSAGLNIGMPFGGRQTERIVNGLQDVGALPRVSASTKNGVQIKKQNEGASYTDSGKLRFPIDTSDPVNVAKDLLFGPFATKEGRAYIASDGKGRSDRVTQNYEDLTKAGIPGTTYLEYYDAAKGMQSDKDAEGNVIRSATSKRLDLLDEMKLDDTQKAMIYRAEIAGEDAQKHMDLARGLGALYGDYYRATYAMKDAGTREQQINALQNAGISDQAAAAVYRAVLANDDSSGDGKLFAHAEESGLEYTDVYRYLVRTNGLKADKDVNGNAVDGSLDEKKVQVLAGLGIGDEQAAALYRMDARESGQRAYDALEKAGMKPAEIFALQKEGKELQSSLAGIVESGKAQGIAPKMLYVAAADIGKMEADTDTEGKSVSGSRQSKVCEYIDALDLSGKQKDWLYLYVGGYTEKNLGKAPWNGGTSGTGFIALPNFKAPLVTLPSFKTP